MAKNDDWMPLYIGDFLADTMHLDNGQSGAYLLLLMHYWRNGPLPDDDAQLATISRTTPKAWKAMSGVIRAFFSLHNGCLRQKRQDIEREKCAELAAVRRRAGKHGAEAKHGGKRLANVWQTSGKTSGKTPGKNVANAEFCHPVCQSFATTPLQVDISLSEGERDISTYPRTRMHARATPTEDRAETRSGLGGQRAPLEPEAPRLDPEEAKAAFAGLVSSLTGRPIYEIQEPTMTVNEQLAALLLGDEP